MFVDKQGERWLVKPRQHIAAQYDDNDTPHIYPALVFSQLALDETLRLFDSSLSPIITNPCIIRKRVFIGKYLRYFPTPWRDTILKYELYQGKELMCTQPRKISTNIYQKLASPTHIRLLALLPCLPGHRHVNIRCYLGEEDSTSCYPYEALSYVWGDASVTRTITVNDESIDVTKNLENALRDLRRTDGKLRILWVDALCINQQDNEERTQQVRQMDMIYKDAREVLVWLGRGSIKSDRAFSYIAGLKQRFGSFPEWFPQHFPFSQEPYCPHCAKQTPFGEKFMNDNGPIDFGDAAWNSRFKVYEAHRSHSIEMASYLWDESTTQHLESLIEIMDLPWWRRVWVIQEFTLAAKISIQLGSRKVDWPFFRAFALQQIRVGQRSRISSGMTTVPSREVHAFRRLTTLAFKALPFFLMPRSNGPVVQHRPKLSQLLCLVLNFQATDPRDFVYSLLGILPEDSIERKLIIPDYTVSAAEIFTQITRMFLESTGTLDVITARPAISSSSMGSNHLLPSWVPDWSAPVSMVWSKIGIGAFSAHNAVASLVQKRSGDYRDSPEVLQYFNRPTDGDVFCASLERTSPFPFRFTTVVPGNDAILQVRGVVVGRILHVGMPLNPFPNSSNVQEIPQRFSRTMDHWKTLCGVQESTGDEVSYHSTGQTRKEAFWRTIMLDRYWSQTTEDSSDDIKRLPKVLTSIPVTDIFHNDGQGPQRFPPETRNDENMILKYLYTEYTQRGLYNSVSCHCVTQMIFTTNTQHLGMCGPNITLGDEVVILCGGTIPYVLRKFKDHYVLMGECYLHGFMDGEGMRSRYEVETKEAKDFDLFDII
ncbi:heterokaryon incompatibility protein-domain-containing protein [Annulohypoxylon bovei var. microspora]|nr:heterokaryon incompatibility protein-domain-containing protein [Annulohypoxylon bovei var. microspora]